MDLDLLSVCRNLACQSFLAFLANCYFLPLFVVSHLFRYSVISDRRDAVVNSMEKPNARQ